MYHFIINPSSKTSKSSKIWNQLETILKDKNIQYISHLTTPTISATDISQQITSINTPINLIVLGGDGTLNEVINGIQNFSLTTLGYIPTGSSNDFARGMNISKDPNKALDTILQAKGMVEIDIGEFHSGDQRRLFIGSSGLGFDASVCVESSVSSIKKFLNYLKLGKFTYILIALKTLFQYKTSQFDVTIDGASYHYNKCYFACILNNKYEGGGFKFTPNAMINDQLLDICIVQGVPKVLILCLLPSAFFGLHTKINGVHIFQAKHVSFKMSDNLDMHVDGEVFNKSNYSTITLSKNKLKLII